MSDSCTRPEAMILNVLRSESVVTLDDLIGKLPELSWSQLFQSVDALNRRGTILLHRRGFQYELSLVRYERASPLMTLEA